MWENRVLVVEEADVISRYHRTARVSSTEAEYCFATYFFTSVISILYTEQHACHNVELLCSTKGIQNITYFLFYSWRIIFIVILLKVATYS